MVNEGMRNAVQYEMLHSSNNRRSRRRYHKERTLLPPSYPYSRG